MSLRFDQLKELRDKTTIKGSYVFLSFSFYAYIFTSFGLLDFENIVNPLDLIYEYLLFLSFLSFTTLIFYYLKIEDFLLKNWLRLKGYLLDYPKFKNVQFYKIINHIYLLDNKNNFISKGISTLALFVFSLIFWNDDLIFYIIIFFIIILISAIILSIIFVKKSINLWIIILSLNLLAFSFMSILINSNILVILFIIPIVLLLISLSFDWKKLEVRIKLIYLMALFIQSRNLIKQKEYIREYVEYIKRNLWNEAKYSLNYILDTHLGFVVKNENQYFQSINFIEEFTKNIRNVNLNDIIENQINTFYKLIDNENFEINTLKMKRLYELIQKIYQSFGSILIILSIFNEWDDWMIFYVFNIEDFSIITKNKKKMEDFREDFMNKMGNIQVKLQELQEISRKDKIDNFKSTFKQEIKNIKKNTDLMDFLNTMVSLKNKDSNTFNLLDFKKLLSKTKEKYIFLGKQIDLKSEVSTLRINSLMEKLKKKIKNRNQKFRNSDS